MAAFPVGILPTNKNDTGLTLTTAQYRDDSARRGGPMILVAAPNVARPAVNPACAAYGASVLILPDASLDAALLYATVSVVGTHAALWFSRD